MPFQTQNGLRFFTFETFAHPALMHAIFTRRGGLSPVPYDSLNVGGFIGDDLDRVIENRKMSFRALGRSVDSIYDVWQVHSAAVICTDSHRPAKVPHLKADAILTDNPAVTLFMRFGDCVPILLFDPVKKVIGIIHAGWQGTVKQMIAAAVKKMVKQYGTRPTDIWAGIGPSIGPHHYEVGPEVITQVKASFGDSAQQLLPTTNGAVQFDLWTANRILLEQAGVHQIEIAEICTACHLEDWFSHRGENGKTGRFGALIGLNAA
jgi:polyphenol oxidase